MKAKSYMQCKTLPLDFEDYRLQTIFKLHFYLLLCKSKGVPLHAMVAHGGRGGIAPTHT
jgi:hypothetical protein